MKASKTLDSGEKELTPSELYGKFLERCMENFHIIIKIPDDTDDMKSLCRTYPEFLNKSVVCYFNQWPEDALQKSAEMVFEELTVSREERKSIITSSREFYLEARKAAEIVNKEMNQKIEISPVSYITFIRFFSELFQKKQLEVSSKKKSYDDIISKYESIQAEIVELETDLQDLDNQIEGLDKEHENIQEKVDSENIKLNSLMKALDEEAVLVDNERVKMNAVKETCDKEFREINQKIIDCTQNIKVSKYVHELLYWF